MRSTVFPGLLALTAVTAGCGFESRVEGTWQPVALEPRALVGRGIPAPMAKALASASLVAEDGVVYVGLKQEQAVLARYQVVSEQDDCATVRLDAVQPESGGDTRTEEVQACLDDGDLILRHGAKGKALAVTFRRAP